MARAPHRRVSADGMIAPGGYPRTAVNFHNQGVARGEYQGTNRSGFTVEFLAHHARVSLDDALGRGVVAIAESSVEAVVAATDETKQKMRTFLDGHFTGSGRTSNNHRRVSNAAVQSVYYDEVAGEPGFASLIYSKFGRGKGPSGFVDFLLLHIKGGTLTPKNGDWLKIPNSEEAGALGGQVGRYAISGSSIFFVESKDDPGKLFLLRRYKGSGKTRLLATLLKSLKIEPTLAGMEVIFARHGARFEQNFDAAFSRRKSEAGLS